MSSIAAGTTLTTALVATGDTAGNLVLKTNGTTTAVTIGTDQVVTLAQPLPVGSGGTGSTSTTFANLTSNVTGTLPVANGGTGATTLTSNNVLLGNGTSAVQFVAPGTNGNVLTSNGTTWTSAVGTSLATPLAVVGNNTAGAEIRLPEDTDNGSNYVALKAADSIASNVTFTLPNADGTSGQVLQTNGSGTLSFATPAGGSWVYLSTVTASNSATMDVETTFDSTYDTYAIVLNDIIPQNDNNDFWIRVKVNGSYQTTDYGFIVNRLSSGSATFDITRSAQVGTRIITAQNVGNASGEIVSGVMYVYSPSSTSSFKTVNGLFSQVSSVGNAIQNSFTGYYSGANATAALTGIRFMMDNGNVTSGTARLYGIKKS